MHSEIELSIYSIKYLGFFFMQTKKQSFSCFFHDHMHEKQQKNYET